MTESTTETNAVEPVVATVDVPADAATAFEIFTSGMGTWWPLADYSLGADRIVAVEFDERAGGEVLEVWDDVLVLPALPARRRTRRATAGLRGRPSCHRV